MEQHPSLSSSQLPETKSKMGKMSTFVAAHSNMALAIIVVLVVLVIVLYAFNQGWFGLGKSKSPSGAKGSGKTSRKQKMRDVTDEETDHLIDSINRHQPAASRR